MWHVKHLNPCFGDTHSKLVGQLVGLNTQPRGRPAVGELMRSPRRLDGPATDTLPATLGARRPHRLLVRRPTHHLAVRM